MDRCVVDVERGVVESGVEVVVTSAVVRGVVAGRVVVKRVVGCTAVCSTEGRAVEACASSLLTVCVVVIPAGEVAEITIAVAGVFRVEAATVRTEAQQGRGREKKGRRYGQANIVQEGNGS